MNPSECSRNTLAYYRAHPHFRALDLSHLRLGPVCQQIVATCGCNPKEITSDGPRIDAVQAAVRFYTLNDLYARINQRYTPYEALPQWAVETMDVYLAEVVDQTRRMFYYTLLACTREARHANPHWMVWSESPAAKSIQPIILSGQAQQEGDPHDDEGRMIYRLLTSPPDLTLGQYVEGLTELFMKAQWKGSLGGKKWGHIAATLLSFVQGKTSGEMLVDTGYTLAHNGGPMFNKGMYYIFNDKDVLFRALDLQHAGYLPEYLLGGNKVNLYLRDEAALAAVKAAENHLPFRPYVDWYAVEKGAMGRQYAIEKEAQKKAGNAPDEAYAGLHPTGELFTVMPGVTLPILEEGKPPKKEKYGGFSNADVYDTTNQGFTYGPVTSTQSTHFNLQGSLATIST